MALFYIKTLQLSAACPVTLSAGPHFLGSVFLVTQWSVWPCGPKGHAESWMAHFLPVAAAYHTFNGLKQHSFPSLGSVAEKPCGLAGFTA